MTKRIDRTGSVLVEAQQIVGGERRQTYGHPFDDYARVGHIMGAILHEWAKKAAASRAPVAVPARLAALCMQAVKISREVHQHKRDNAVDGAGYWWCVDEIGKAEETMCSTEEQR